MLKTSLLPGNDPAKFDKDITTNLPYVPGVHIAFDHHLSETIRNTGERANHVIHPEAPSAARVPLRGTEADMAPLNAEMQKMDSTWKSMLASFARDSASPTAQRETRAAEMQRQQQQFAGGQGFAIHGRAFIRTGDARRTSRRYSGNSAGSRRPCPAAARRSPTTGRRARQSGCRARTAKAPRTPPRCPR